MRAHFQQIDLHTLFAATGAEYHRVRTAEHAVDDIAMVLARIATTRRPVVIDGSRRCEARRQAPTRGPRRGPRAPCVRESPLILAGRGPVLFGAGPALRSWRTCCRAVGDHPGAKDPFRGHAYDLGIMGNLGALCAVA